MNYQKPNVYALINFKRVIPLKFLGLDIEVHPQIFTKVFYEEYDGKTDVKINREKITLICHCRLGMNS